MIAKDYHPFERDEETSYAGMSSVVNGRNVNKVMQIEPFNAWLIREKLELLVDFREVAIAEGWRPSYPGCAADPPTLPPPELRHWYPERTGEPISEAR